MRTMTDNKALKLVFHVFWDTLVNNSILGNHDDLNHLLAKKIKILPTPVCSVKESRLLQLRRNANAMNLF